METLKKGSKGEDVKALQRALGITADGDFGPGTEKAVKEFQKNHGLVADGIVGNKTWEAILGQQNDDVKIDFQPISKHITKAKGREIKYLVIHFTAGTSSKEGNALAARKVFLNRDASADFVVDDETIVQINPEPKDYYCWAVGDGKGKYGVTNKNSIHIEICSNLEKGTTAKVPNHEGWSFTDASIDNTIKLSKLLIRKYNIPFKNVIRHYDASRKLCPGILGWNPGFVYDKKTGARTAKHSGEEKWVDFKNRLAEL
jgi:N-acetylmuramoyl-L-alanine amidase CwlA